VSKPIVRAMGFAAILFTGLGLSPIPGARAGELRVTPSIELRETVSDNIDLASKGAEKSAAMTEVVPGVEVRSDSARFTGAMDLFPILRHQTAGGDEGASLAGDLAALGELEALEDHLFFDAQASVSQQNLDNRDVASTANQKTVALYRFSPNYKHRFAGFAEAQARYRLSQIYVDANSNAGGTATASDSTTHSVSASLASGHDFTSFKWTLSGLLEEQDRTDAENISRHDLDLDLEYAFSRLFSLLAGGGYQTFDDGNIRNEIDGATWRVGFRLRPGPRTDLRVTYGHRDDDESANVDFSYAFSSRTKVIAGYSRIIETSQERLDQSLSRIALDPATADLIDTQTEQAFDPNTSPFGINNRTTRTESFRLGLNGSRDRNAFGVNALVANEETLPSGVKQDAVQVSGHFSRRITRHTNLNLFTAYEKTKFDDGQEDNEYFVQGGLSYNIYENVNAGITYSYRTQESNRETSKFSENRVLLNVKMNFKP
jgi:uncharacterized protein (PEP-CTERM system associated)